MAKKPRKIEQIGGSFEDVFSGDYLTEIQVFDYNSFSVRTVNIDDEIWFIGIDVCKILDIKNPSDAFSRLNKADLGSTEVSYGSQFRNLVIINESGLYDLVLDSRKPEAKNFRRWITKDVLPSIRRTGKYELPSLQNLSEDERRLLIRQQIKDHNPKLSEQAQKAGVGISGIKRQDQREFAIFHNKGYQGLYGGLGKKEIARKKGLREDANILDHMNSTELAANFFRVTQTEERLKNNDISTKEGAFRAHFLVGQEVRKAMIAIGGVRPEDIPFEENIKKLEKKSKYKAYNSTKKLNTKKIEIDISTQLWAVALLIASTKPAGIITTKELHVEIPKYIEIPEKYLEYSETKGEPKINQVIRNLKSNKNNKTSMFLRGYAIDVQGGFQITKEGLEFVKEVFKDFI